MSEEKSYQKPDSPSNPSAPPPITPSIPDKKGGRTVEVDQPVTPKPTPNRKPIGKG